MQLIAFVLVLPGLVFSVLLLLRLSALERMRGQQAAEAAAVRTADAVDRELANMRAILRVLATSPALATVDIPAFDRQARAVGATMGLNVVMTDRDGQQYVNTRSEPGAPLPRTSVTDALQEVVATGRPGLSDLYLGAISGAPAVAVLLPVPEQAQPDWVLISSMQPSHLARLLQAQALPSGWVGAVIDGRGTIIARSVDHDRQVGRRASADLIEHATGERGGWEGTSVDGVAVLAAYARVGGADWRVAVGVPLKVVRAPFRATLAILTAAGAGSLALSLLLAWGLGRQIAGPLRALAVAGRRIGQDGTPVMPTTGITEMDVLAGTLAATSSDLLARTEALMAERARLAAIIDTVPVGLVIAAADGRILSGNAQFERTFRRPALGSGGAGEPDEWMAFHRDGRRMQEADHPLRRVLRGEDRAELTCQYQRGDGTRFWVGLVAAPIRPAPGAALAGVVVAILDIDEVVRAREAKAQFAETLQAEVAERTAALRQTNQRLRDEMSARAAAEEQLRQSQKMESVGRLTGGIAHDFNNLLTVVIGSLDLLGRRITEPKHRRLVDNAMDGATRAATLTARLLAFSRQQPLQPQALDVNRLVDGMGHLLHRVLGETIQVDTRLAPDAWPVHADPNQLESALLNLAVNARDAMARENGRIGRRLTITTANRVLAPGAPPPDTLPPDTLPGDYAEIAVADTGTGMTPEIVAQVFEPFFTTKPQGQGTGLGLSQVHGFVKQSGGSVVVDTAPGQGTTMRVLLPRLREPAGVGVGVGAVPPELHALPRAAGETVLVVEDEAGVRRFTTEALRELGYVVIGGATAAEGMRLLQAHPEVSLLFTDIVLPDESGRLLAARARHHRPRLPVLFTTGYVRDAVPDPDGEQPALDLIAKPFTVAALGEKVRAVLDGLPSPSSSEKGPG